MKYGILPTLTRDYILSQISQEQIFEYYLGIKVEPGTLLRTPAVIRPGDSNPTFSFKYSDNGKLRARDWAGYFWGDCFDVVAYILRLKAEDKKSFNLILDQIARDFRLHKYADKAYIDSGSTYDIREVLKKSSKTEIMFQARDWNRDLDGKFWLDGNINRKLLEQGRVFPCFAIFVNNQPVYNFVPSDPAYAYKFTDTEIKIYFPRRKKFRFLSNTSYLQGVDLLEPAQYGVVTKSYKDVLSLRSYGIQAVAPSSETVPIRDKEWFRLKNTCDHWFSLFDFDRTGILMALKLRRLYNITPLFFANSKRLQKLKEDKEGEFTGSALASNYPMFSNVKDFYDLRKHHGNAKVLEVIRSVQEKYEPALNEYDSKIYYDLKWLYDQKNNP